MKKWLLIIPLLFVAGCERGSFGIDLPRLSLYSQQEIESGVSREQFCRFSREALGLPVLLNSGLRSEAYAALGKEKAANLFRPVARANNAFRCICGTPDERLIAKC